MNKKREAINKPKTYVFEDKAAKNKKISDALKAAHAKRKLEKEEAERIQAAMSQRVAAISAIRDASRYNFTNLSLGQVSSILNSTQSGIMKTWSDFCDFIYEREIQIRALCDLRMNSISSDQKIITPANQTPEAQLAADFIRDSINEIEGFDKIIKFFLYATFNGCQTAEILYKRDDYKDCFSIKEIIPIPLSKMKIRLNPVTTQDEHVLTNVTTGYGQWIYSYWNYGDNQYGEGIDIQAMYPGKFIIHSPGANPVPHYRGLFRSAAFAFLKKEVAEAIWIAGAEKYAYPVTYAKVPKHSPANTRINLVENLNNLANDAAAVFDEDVSIDTISGGASGGDNVWNTLCAYVNASLAKLIVGGTLTVEATSSGANRALGEVMERTREDIVKSDANSLAETFKDQLIKPLLEKNLHLFGGVMPPIPNISFDTRYRNYQPIDQLAVDVGSVTMNEFRDSRSLPLWSEDQGGNAIVKKAVEQPTARFGITNGNNFDNASTAYVGKEEEKE